MRAALPTPNVTDLFLETLPTPGDTACGRCGTASDEGDAGALVSVRGRLLGWCCASCAAEVAA